MEVVTFRSPFGTRHVEVVNRSDDAAERRRTRPERPKADQSDRRPTLRELQGHRN